MQLALNLKLHTDATFNNFISGSNQLVVTFLKKMVQSDSEQSCFIWSKEGEGVSHLLQAVCHEARLHRIGNIYLPLKELKALGCSLLNEIELISIVCLDDIEVIAGDKDWEEALFYAFNRLRESGCRLIVGGHNPLTYLGFHLPDLLSRMSWGVAYKLNPLDDGEKIALLQENAKRRGFALPLDVAKYMLTHYSRDLRTQLDLLEELDAISLREKHKITLPFVKHIFNLSHFRSE